MFFRICCPLQGILVLRTWITKSLCHLSCSVWWKCFPFSKNSNTFNYRHIILFSSYWLSYKLSSIQQLILRQAHILVTMFPIIFYLIHWLLWFLMLYLFLCHKPIHPVTLHHFSILFLIDMSHSFIPLSTYLLTSTLSHVIHIISSSSPYMPPKSFLNHIFFHTWSSNSNFSLTSW